MSERASDSSVCARPRVYEAVNESGSRMPFVTQPLPCLLRRIASV